MDDVDLRLLRGIQARPDLPIADLAREVGLSQTPAWRRLRKLQEEGYIVGRVTVLDADRLGLGVNVFAHLRLARHDEETLERLESETRELPQIVECFSMSGESDYMLRVIVRSVGEYEQFLKKTLLHLPGVASINSSFALKRIKATTDLPI